MLLLLILAAVENILSENNSVNNVLSHSAYITIFPSEQSLSIVDTFVVVTSGSEIPLRLSQTFEIDAAEINGRRTIPLREGALLQIRDVLSDTNTIVLQYHGRTPSNEMTHCSDSFAVLREEDVLPQGFHDYRFATITLQVPNDWEAIASGKLIEKKTENDSVIFCWKTETLVPSLGWFVAGKYYVATTYVDSIPIMTYVSFSDTAVVEKLHSLSKNVLKVFQEKFNTYRFPKLAIVEVEDFVAGKNVAAAAYPSCILVKKQTFATQDTFNSAMEILPHEIAHQWWPLSVFVNDEDLAVLSEGLCEFSARLFHETNGDNSMRDDLQYHPLLRSLIVRAQQQNEVPLQKKADLRTIPTQYLKAYYVHTMLRIVIGEKKYEELLSAFAKNFWMKKISLDDFQTLAEVLSEKNLDWFFEQWVKNTGIPRLKLYNVKTFFSEQHWRTKGNVRVVGYKQFTTPVFVEARSERDTVEKKIFLGKLENGKYINDVSFEIRTKEKPREVILNPRRDILLSKKMPPRFSDLREPADGIMIIGSKANTDSLWKYARRDSATMDKGGWWITMKVDSAVTLSDLQRARVFLYGTKKQNSIAEKFEKYFPLRIVNDSAMYRDSIWFDTTNTLGVMEIADNSFSANGLVCWIAPIGNNVQMQLLPYPHSYVVFREGIRVAEGTWEIEDEEYAVKIQ
ncbi:MAG: M1 family metallopeptidase [Ignavibacteria bacterium]|nr:M1 family metallopeptidase [Ignavibacteria bacterium]